MTIREFYVNVLDLIDVIESDDPTGCVDTKAMGDKARELITALDVRNAKRKSADSKEKREVRERVQMVLDFLCDHQGESFDRDAIASAIGLSVGQVTAACKPIVVDGTITRAETKVGKTRKVVYTYPIEG